MTIQGSIYFCACHMLYTVMQMYYEFAEVAALNMNKVVDRYAKWNSTYHEIMGWSLEEIVFPFEYEKTPLEKAKAMGNLAEIRDEELAKEAYDTIINTA